MFKLSPTKFFVYCALIFGIILITLIPPFQSPDEDSHFKRAYVISQGDLYPSSQNGIVGYFVPNDMSAYISEKQTFIGNRDRKYTYSEEILDDRLPKDYSDRSFQNFSTAETTPIAYLAPASGIVFAKISERLTGIEKISVTYMLHFARFFSLILYVVIVGLAIKITPILKKTFCLIGLIPMSLYLAVAISYDSVLIAISMLATALIFKLKFDENIKKVSWWHIIALGIMGYILLKVKTVYITLLIPLIFIPREKYGKNKKEIIKVIAMILGIVVGLFIINKIPSLTLQRAAADNSASSQQLQLIIHHPISYLKMALKIMWENRNFYYSGMFGMFGLIDTYLPTVYMFMYMIAFVCIIIADLSLCEKKFNWKYKTIAILGCIASVFGVFTAMYVYWTSMEKGVGADTITGVQGIYFLPIIPLGMIIFSNSILAKKEILKKLFNNVLENSYLISFIMLAVSSITILLRYWC